MARYFSADYILPVSDEPIENGAVVVGNDGEILEVITDARQLSGKPVEKLSGIIVPGFVNSHCHLELSHLKNKFPQKQGLISFIKQVIASRAASDKTVTEAMEKADRAMYENGIVAVGDISNRDISGPVKKGSLIYYHTYIETICFDPDKAKDVFANALTMREKFAPLSSSVVPHAPYSVCKELLRLISNFRSEDNNLFTIHNQECDEENQFYRYKKGPFIDFYKDLGINLDFFKSQARNSIQTLLRYLPDNDHVMLVHNTYTSLRDIYFVKRMGKPIHWCLCPNANLYIEGRLPKLELFLMNGIGDDILLGTDSLASNNELCILSELKTLHTSFPDLTLAESIKWATLNGARFLKIDKRYGSIEPGKKPGLNLIRNVNGLQLTEKSKVKRLI